MLPVELPVLLFYLFSFLTIGAALMVIMSSDPVRAVLFLIVTFFNAAGIFILLKAELVAMLLVIVYVGAVAVLFLFVVMMLNINVAKAKENIIGYAPLGIVVAIILFVELFFIIQSSTNVLDNKIIENKNVVAENVIKETSIEIAKIKDEKQIVTIDSKEKKFTNAETIGMVLYTKYAYLFQLCGLILLVAMVGAITLAHRQRDGVKKQNISEQLSRDKRKTIELVKVESGKGV